MLSIENIADDFSGWSFPTANFAVNSPDFIIAPPDITVEILNQYSDYRNLEAVKHDNILPIPLRAFQNQSERMLDEARNIAEYAYPQVFR
jgi:ABC-type Fe3+-hydroxamate transport system substrate-binding protein